MNQRLAFAIKQRVITRNNTCGNTLLHEHSISFYRALKLTGYAKSSALIYTAEGKTSSEVADILRIAERTVNFHINNAMAKLKANNKTAAVIGAAALGLLHGEFFNKFASLALRLSPLQNCVVLLHKKIKPGKPM